MADSDLNRRLEDIADALERIEEMLARANDISLRDREALGLLFERSERRHRESIRLIRDVSDEVHAQSEGLMRIIDHLGPIDPPDGKG